MPIVNTAKKYFLEGSINFLTDTIKVMLLTNTHTTNVDTQEFIDDVSANQVTGTGYTAGGAAIGGKTSGVDNTANTGNIDGNNVTWDASGGSLTARYAAIYKDTGTPGTSPIIGIIDFGSDKTAINNDFTIQWNAIGIIVGS